MKKYISPITEIILANLSSANLAPASQDPHNGVIGDSESALNQGFFDDVEGNDPPKNNSLWDE